MDGGYQNADKSGMGTISSLASTALQSVLSSVLQGTGSTTNQTGSSAGASSISVQPDNARLSPFAQMMSELQQLQQSDPSKFQQVTQQIATNLSSAAQTAQANGNTSAANQLNQLAADFTNASKSGQMPSGQDLAQALGGHHHHHHGHAASANSDSTTSSSDTSSSTANQGLSQLLSTLDAAGSQNDSTNPMAIILNTLSNAGISVSTGS